MENLNDLHSTTVVNVTAQVGTCFMIKFKFFYVSLLFNELHNVKWSREIIMS